VKGLPFDWSTLYPTCKPQRLPLPTYPFARERYWAPADAAASIGGTQALHPLLHANTSDLAGQRFTSRFTGAEPFLADHVVAGTPLLPAAACLEMARAGCAQALGIEGSVGSLDLADVVWLRPLRVAETPLVVHLDIAEDGEGLAWEIVSGAPGAEEVNARGRATSLASSSDASATATAPLDLALLKTQCTTTWSAAECYQRFTDLGIAYGPAHRGLGALMLGTDADGRPQVLARIDLPAAAGPIEDYGLHPSLIDAALQAAIGLNADNAAQQGAPVPFALSRLRTLAPLKPNMWALVRLEEAVTDSASTVAIDLFDDDGNVCLEARGLLSRSIEPQPVASPATEAIGGDAAPAQEPVRVSDGIVEERTLGLLRTHMAQVLDVRADDIDPEAGLDEYGFDSISLTDFADALNGELGLALTPALFFECRSLGLLARHLLDKHRDVLAARYGTAAAVSAPAPSPQPRRAEEKGRARLRGGRRTSAPLPQPPSGAVAVIGMSGRFPMAENVAALWKNLAEGRDCIAEAPQERWDWRPWLRRGADADGALRWGGFIDGVDEFDPLFFGISPKEAELMDPQQRLLMQEVWATLEDAGYAAGSLAKSATGVFIGIGGSGYAARTMHPGADIEGHSSTGVVPSAGPNRISYLLDLNGPSQAIETACSSSLVAVHRAVQSLMQGECTLALAGGVNLLLAPELSVSFDRAGMLSPNGRCKTFSDAADGYVRGEGVGILLLKPLAAAERDSDRIYGVIRSTGENHGGRAQSLTAPNPNAQADLIAGVCQRAGIDPRSIGYVEAHGTGTPLGDPIEIAGLGNAFARLAEAKGVSLPQGYCGVGSIKSNIGHLEMAAGIAGLIKCLLQIKHRQLAPSLHCERINPYIALADSPFYIVKELADWPALHDAAGHAQPRRAGVSSFGFGGANAHVILEEYLPRPQDAVDAASLPPPLIVLSARNAERLRERVTQLLTAIADNGFGEEQLPAIAYTLQIGREPMAARLALRAESLSDLRHKLERFLAGDAVSDLFHGEVKRDKDALSHLTDEDMAKGIAAWVAKGKWNRLLELWVKGLPFDWSTLYPTCKPQRLPLPTYPFARERYWAPADAAIRVESIAEWDDEAGQPVIGAPISAETLQEQTLAFLRGLLAKVLDVRADDIDVEAGLDEYGFDSVMAMKLRDELEEVFGPLSSVLPFEQRTLAEAALYFREEHAERLHELFAPRLAPAPRRDPTSKRALAHKGPNGASHPQRSDAIAIIGLAGRYPAAEDVAAFWRNLCAGRDSISEIPPARWDPRRHLDREGRPYGVWGGFIDGVDEFDPLFFGISPKEAELMDPQERLFLQCAYAVMEDAGYTREALGRYRSSGLEGNVGVYVGVTYQEYQLYGAQEQQRGHPLVLM
ncbi:MAG: beta-ketoacyl synthase N-terminal-like domain-containing protein, partial [Croceibacterium sp.]